MASKTVLALSAATVLVQQSSAALTLTTYSGCENCLCDPLPGPLTVTVGSCVDNTLDKTVKATCNDAGTTATFVTYPSKDCSGDVADTDTYTLNKCDGVSAFGLKVSYKVTGSCSGSSDTGSGSSNAVGVSSVVAVFALISSMMVF